jgi:hypothetical protein
MIGSNVIPSTAPDHRAVPHRVDLPPSAGRTMLNGAELAALRRCTRRPTVLSGPDSPSQAAARPSAHYLVILSIMPSVNHLLIRGLQHLPSLRTDLRGSTWAQLVRWAFASRATRVAIRPASMASWVCLKFSIPIADTSGSMMAAMRGSSRRLPLEAARSTVRNKVS